MPDSKDIANNTNQGLPSKDADYRSSLRRINSLETWMDRLHIYEIIGVFVLLVILAVFLFVLGISVYYVWKQIVILGNKIGTLDAVIIAAIIAGACSILHIVVSKLIDNATKKHQVLFEKKIQAYESAVGFIFQYQKREGYNPCINWGEAQLACFSVNQQIMLWGSEPVRRAWEKYLVESWRQDDDSYHINAPHVFETIAREINPRFKLSSPLSSPCLSLFYDYPVFEFVVSGKKYKVSCKER